jgi:predicted O-methyltransferase YrrM
VTRKTTDLTPELYAYLLDYGVREADILKRLRLETANDEWARMQISPEQGQFMSFITSLIQPTKILEIGTYTGYSALTMILAASSACKLLTCDVSKTWTDIAKRYWKEAKVDNQITVKLAPAIDTLNQLLESGEQETYQLIFIDADKENYPAYYRLAKKLIAPEGVILIDNVFWNGSVTDSSDCSAATSSVRELNELLIKDTEMEISMLPMSDGLSLAKKINKS